MSVKQTLTPNDTNAIAAIGPQAEVAKLIQLYQEASSEFSFFYDERFNPNIFEREVLNRKDQYLDLLLSKTVRELETANELWNRATMLHSSPSYSSAIKENLVQAIGTDLLLGHEFSGTFTSAGKDVFPNFDSLTELGYAAFKSEKNRSLIRSFVSGAHGDRQDSPFSSSSDTFKADVWEAIARNNSVNIDTTDSEGPDLKAMEIQDGVRAFFQTTPIERFHLRLLHTLVDHLNPTVHRFNSDFDAEKFISRWTLFPGVSKEEVEKIKQIEGFYTSFSLVDEMLAIFIAKFQPNLTPKSNYKNIDAAQKSDDLLAKAAYFGRIKTSVLAGEIETGYVEKDCLVLALQNPYLYVTDPNFETIENYVYDYPEASEIVFLFNRQKNLFNKKNDQLVVARFSESQTRDDFDIVIGMLSKIKSDVDRAKEGWEQTMESLKVLKWWLFIFAAVYAAKTWW